MDYDATFLKIVNAWNSDGMGPGREGYIFLGNGVMMDICFHHGYKYSLHLVPAYLNGMLMPAPEQLPKGGMYSMCKGIFTSSVPSFL